MLQPVKLHFILCVLQMQSAAASAAAVRAAEALQKLTAEVATKRAAAAAASRSAAQLSAGAKALLARAASLESDLQTLDERFGPAPPVAVAMPHACPSAAADGCRGASDDANCHDNAKDGCMRSNGAGSSGAGSNGKANGGSQDDEDMQRARQELAHREAELRSRRRAAKSAGPAATEPAGRQALHAEWRARVATFTANAASLEAVADSLEAETAAARQKVSRHTLQSPVVSAATRRQHALSRCGAMPTCLRLSAVIVT